MIDLIRRQQEDPSLTSDDGQGHLQLCPSPSIGPNIGGYQFRSPQAPNDQPGLSSQEDLAPQYQSPGIETSSVLSPIIQQNTGDARGFQLSETLYEHEYSRSRVILDPVLNHPSQSVIVQDGTAESILTDQVNRARSRSRESWTASDASILLLVKFWRRMYFVG